MIEDKQIELEKVRKEIFELNDKISVYPAFGEAQHKIFKKQLKNKEWKEVKLRKEIEDLKKSM